MNLPRTWFFLPRAPEPEAMESNEEAEAYSSAAAHAHLDLLANTFVDHAASLGAQRALRARYGSKWVMPVGSPFLTIISIW